MSNLWGLEDTNTAKYILNSLSPINITIEALSCKDANILTDEGALKLLFSALEMENSALSQKLLNELKMPLMKRRNESTVLLLKFLQDPNNLLEQNDEFFNSTLKLNIIKVAKAYMRILFNNSDQNGFNFEQYNSSFESDGVVEENNAHKNNINLKRKLEESMHAIFQKTQQVANNFTTLTREFNLYEATGELTSNLKNS